MKRLYSSKNKSNKKTRVLTNYEGKMETIYDLEGLSKSKKFYLNIDMFMLRKISFHLTELCEMVGMESLKQTLFSQILYFIQRMHTRFDENNSEYLHTAIYAPPGCGKTTVAHIIGNIYKDLGILSKGTFTIAHRDDFIAQYLGQTAIKTKNLLNKCKGGVLFIDEVYSLASSRHEDSFSKEAIDTINSFLSEHKNDFCCIIAGYKEEVRDTFFASNKGLERRFPWTHTIEKYTNKNLSEIFLNLLRKQNWNTTVSTEFLNKLFQHNKDIFKAFGGDVETFITKSKMCHSQRVFLLEENVKYYLTEKDLTDGIEYIKRNKDVEINRPPEHMYI